MELKITASPEVLDLVNKLAQALTALTSEEVTTEGEAPKRRGRGKPTKAEAEAPEAAKVETEVKAAAKVKAEAEAKAAEETQVEGDFELGAVEEVVTFDDLRALAMGLSGKGAAATAGIRTLFARYKIQKLSELNESKWVDFHKELKALDAAV